MLDVEAARQASTVATCWRKASSRQCRLAPLEETADRRVAFETNRDFIGLARCAVCACSREQLSAGSAVGLIFGEPRISGYLGHRRKSGAPTMQLSKGQSAIDSDH